MDGSPRLGCYGISGRGGKARALVSDPEEVWMEGKWWFGTVPFSEATWGKEETGRFF